MPQFRNLFGIILYQVLTVAVDAGPMGPKKERGIVEFAMENRRSNVLRVSKQACDECITLEGFLNGNRYAFLLFYDRPLVSNNRYKAAIVKGFHEVCADLRWSRVACGVVDMLNDRDYAERYIDPKTAPAHIVWKDAEPMPTQKKQLDELMKKPGDKGTMMWHVRDLLTPEEAPGSLDISVDVADEKALAKVLKRHDVVVVATVGNTKTPGKAAGRAVAAADVFRAAAQRLTLDGSLVAEIEASGFGGGEGASDTPPMKGVKRWRRARERRRIVFVVLRGVQALSAHGLTEGMITAFVGRTKQGDSQDLNLDAPPTETELAQALRKVVSPALRTAVEAAATKDAKEL